MGIKGVIIMKVSIVKIIILATSSVLLLVTILLLVWRNHYINYTDPKGHLLKGSYADSGNVFDGTLGVVTWNLHFGEKLDEIITTLVACFPLLTADGLHP